MATPPEIFFSTVKRFLRDANLPQELTEHLKLSPGGGRHNGPVIPSSFAIGTAAQATIAASGLAASHLLRTRGGPVQYVSVDERHALLEFISEAWCQVDGKPPSARWDSITRAYKTKDGYIRIHTNIPHQITRPFVPYPMPHDIPGGIHRHGILDLLGCDETDEAVQASLLTWSALDFEQVAIDRGLCTTALRSFDEWDRHPQAIALKDIPPLSIIKIGDGRPCRSVGKVTPKRPLEGIRVLELTRVVAGPVAGRTLAAHGADVLWVTCPNLPGLPILDQDTSRGKRTTQLDLNQPEDHQKLEQLIKEADVFLQSYRPRTLEAKGFGPARLAEIRPGIVIANLRAYGWEGPWRDRRGFDPLVQTATGFNVAEAEAYNLSQSLKEDDTPVPLKGFPMQCLDHSAGQLLTLGIISALDKTYRDGGSYEVRVSLASAGNFLRSLPRLPPSIGFGPEAQPFPTPTSREIQDLSYTVDFPASKADGGTTNLQSPIRMSALMHAAVLSETPVKLGVPPGGLSAHEATWLNRSDE